MKRFSLGFTLTEILVVVAVITILSSVLYVNFNSASAQARDAQRKADLRELQTAVELYKNRYGRYPAGCNTAPSWSGLAPAYACPAGQQYIVGLAPEFIPALPVDPKPNGSDSGYVYVTNAAGTVYKIMAKKTVEKDFITIGKAGNPRLNARNHGFASCDISNSSIGICDQLYNLTSFSENVSTPTWCLPGDNQFETSYGLWGGYANTNLGPSHTNYQRSVERDTEAVICRIQ